MNAVKEYLDVLQRQWDLLCGLDEYDQYCASIYARGKRVGRIHNGCQRRGWTRQDVNRQHYAEQSMLALPNIHRPSIPIPPAPKHMDTRLKRYLARNNFSGIASEAAQNAIDYVTDTPQFSVTVGSAVTELLTIHLEWLEYMKQEYSSDIQERWRNAKSKLDGISEMLAIIERVEPNPLAEIERELKPRLLPIWEILKRRGRRKIVTHYDDIRTDLINEKLTDLDIETISKYVRQIKNICQAHSIELETFGPRSMKVLLKI